MIKLRRYLAYYKKECIIGPLCKLFEAILELLVPLVMAGIIDNGVRNGDTAYIWKMGGLLVILATVGLCSALVCQYLASKASQGVGTRLRRDLFLHINRLSHAELDRLGTPSLITRITYDTNQVQQSVAMAIRLLTRAPFIVIGSMVMAMTINLEMSIIFFIAAILIAVTLYLIMTKSIPIFEKMQKKLDKISLICRENLSGNRVIEPFQSRKMRKSVLTIQPRIWLKLRSSKHSFGTFKPCHLHHHQCLQLFSSFGLALGMSTQARNAFGRHYRPCKLYDADFACNDCCCKPCCTFHESKCKCGKT